VGADLAALCNEAALSALRRYISLKEGSTHQLARHDTSVDKCNNQENDPSGCQISSLSSSLEKLTMSLEGALCTKRDNSKNSESDDEEDKKLLFVTTEDFEKAKIKVRPSAMREVSPQQL
jgi:AAA family ATPase